MQVLVPFLLATGLGVAAFVRGYPLVRGWWAQQTCVETTATVLRSEAVPVHSRSMAGGRNPEIDGWVVQLDFAHTIDGSRYETREYWMQRVWRRGLEVSSAADIEVPLVCSELQVCYSSGLPAEARVAGDSMTAQAILTGLGLWTLGVVLVGSTLFGAPKLWRSELARSDGGDRASG